MAETTNVQVSNPEPPPAEDPLIRVADATEPDWFLRHLVWLANLGAVEAGVTLVCGGTIVSGTLVSGATYVKGFRDEFTSALADELKGALAQVFDVLAKPYEPSNAEESALTVEHTQYIHLRDARFYASGQPPMPGNRGIWWRGRLALVSGFSLGQLSADQPKG